MEIYIRAQLFLCILISITYDTESIHHGILWKYYENITASSSAGVKSYKFSLSKENINFSSSTQLMTYHIQTFNKSIAVKLRRLEQKDRNDAFHKVILENRHQENLTCYWSMSSANAKAIFSNCKNQLKRHP
ncbi:uncharacterized protein LOC124459432 isoform X2 [Xenia sp. Carnegie-2017]|uniref:uncharacterized protein LOC124459432 isoform X2 n=1 Tax=Xenia sp. Carnegie-2017 TaxID=2897299 RepID=UPI001F03713E|nr:uncharacterized protein LOC124459432 isoform X2 [Xenia sp. Carnegie-2017]